MNSLTFLLHAILVQNTYIRIHIHKKINELLIARDPTMYAKFDESHNSDSEAEEEGENEHDQNTSTKDSNSRKKNSSSSTAVQDNNYVPVEASADDLQDDALDLSNFDSIFENALWEVELTDGVRYSMMVLSFPCLHICENLH
jgi:hypothetical protein